jgi:predicted dehydrogenase
MAMTEIPLPRRDFLSKTGKLLMGSLTFPQIVSTSVFGRNGSTAASDRIVMGCIGLGGQGTRGMAGGIWAPEGGFIGRDEIQMVAVCDVNRLNRENARDIVNRKYGNRDCAVFGDYRELLARQDIDAVLIATGERWHPLISIAAAKSGKDIYCEKPLSVTIAEAKAVRQAIHGSGSIYQLGTQQRSSWAFRFACELVRNGYIGDIKTVTVAVGGPIVREPSLPAQPVPDYLDYDRWLGPIPWRPYNEKLVTGWMDFRDCAGGEMTNWGAHHFDIAQWGLGMDESGPVEIIPPDGKEYSTITYFYANGARVMRDPQKMLREAGQDNGVMFEGTQGKIAVWRYDLRTWPASLRRKKLGPNDLRLHECDNHHTDFLNSVRTRSLPGSNIDAGSRSITVCHLGNIAYELGRPLKWDPVREDFVNDPEASRRLSRPMRSPWHL